jgi:hypothetical protein
VWGTPPPPAAPDRPPDAAQIAEAGADAVPDRLHLGLDGEPARAVRGRSPARPRRLPAGGEHDPPVTKAPRNIDTSGAAAARKRDAHPGADVGVQR